MPSTLSEVYREGRRRGFIREPYPLWREEVIKRVNKLFHQNHVTLTDGEIEEYLEKAEIMRRVDETPCRVFSLVPATTETSGNEHQVMI